VVAEVTYAAPHHLVADRMLAVRQTRAGDAWETRTAATPADDRVVLPMPAMPVR
jgi:tRNA-2-methylthio-N6-dimethylallyladenosine synthase